MDVRKREMLFLKVCGVGLSWHAVREPRLQMTLSCSSLISVVGKTGVRNL